jgi:CubicO group peptidase (beta-lactamase class C family)
MRLVLAWLWHSLVWADREKRVAATERTMYSLASITKPSTATALMTFVQQTGRDGTPKVELRPPD